MAVRLHHVGGTGSNPVVPIVPMQIVNVNAFNFLPNVM